MKNLEKTDYQILLFVASKNNTTLSAIKNAFSENTSTPEDRLKVLAEHKLIIIHTEYVPYKGKSKNVMGDFEPNGQISITETGVAVSENYKIMQAEIAAKLKEDRIWKAIPIGISFAALMVSAFSLAKSYGAI